MDHQELWAFLANHCGARPEMDASFPIHFPRCREYRFIGALGFGGKVRANEDGRNLRVTCYPESETPERLKMIEAANAALKGKRLRSLTLHLREGVRQ